MTILANSLLCKCSMKGTQKSQHGIREEAASSDAMCWT